MFNIHQRDAGKESGGTMTKREAAISVICVGNWCTNGCPMHLAGEFKCLANKTTEAELIKIARKEYERKSKKNTGADDRLVVAKEWKIIGKGAKVV